MDTEITSAQNWPKEAISSGISPLTRQGLSTMNRPFFLCFVCEAIMAMSLS